MIFFQVKRVPTVGEISLGDREPDNFEDHHAVCVREDGRVVGRLETGASGKFSSSIKLIGTPLYCDNYQSASESRRHVGDESAM